MLGCPIRVGQGRNEGILPVQAGNLFRIGKRYGGLGFATTATALIQDLYAYHPAFILFLPETHAHKVTGHPNTSKSESYTVD